MIWAELTVPLEENVIDAEIRKTERYLKLANSLRSKRQPWTVHPFTIEVGSIGWVANSTSKFIRSLGFNRQQSKWIKKRISLAGHHSWFRAVDSISSGRRQNARFLLYFLNRGKRPYDCWTQPQSPSPLRTTFKTLVRCARTKMF